MDLHDSLTGRKEIRLLIVVAVNVAPLKPVSPERHERTYTDNLSAHGARLRLTHAWELGDLAEITPVSGETPVRGEVVYCQRLYNHGFFVGIKIRESRIPWSILQRFDGMPVPQRWVLTWVLGMPYPYACRKRVVLHKADPEMNKLTWCKRLKLDYVSKSDGVFAAIFTAYNADSQLRIESLYDSSHVAPLLRQCLPHSCRYFIELDA